MTTHEWVHAPFTLDGAKVYALIHDEYHGWEHTGMCSSQGRPPNRPKALTIPVAGFNPGCWYNAITLRHLDRRRLHVHARHAARTAGRERAVYLHRKH